MFRRASFSCNSFETATFLPALELRKLTTRTTCPFSRNSFTRWQPLFNQIAFMKKALPWILIGGVVVALVGASWPALRLAKLEGGEFVSRLGALLVFAVLIERTVKVFLTIWRAENSYARQAEVKRLISDGKSATDPELKAAQEELLKYRVETQRWALPSSFILGLILASFGVRVVAQFVASADVGVAAPGEIRLRCFDAADIILTAALLAGGADPIHKLMDAFRKFMEASSAKASGTVKS